MPKTKKKNSPSSDESDSSSSSSSSTSTSSSSSSVSEEARSRKKQKSKVPATKKREASSSSTSSESSDASIDRKKLKSKKSAKKNGPAVKTKKPISPVEVLRKPSPSHEAERERNIRQKDAKGREIDDFKSGKSKWESPKDNGQERYRREEQKTRDRDFGQRDRFRKNDDDRSPGQRNRRRSPQQWNRNNRNQNSFRGGGGSRYNNNSYQDRRLERRPSRPSRSPPASTDNRRRRDNDEDQSRNRDNGGRDRPAHDRRHARSRSPPATHNRSKRNRRSSADDNKSYEWGRRDDRDRNSKSKEPQVEKEKPNFGLSGKLTEDTNKVNGIVIKYSEPQESRKPKRRWRLYPFKGEQALPTLYIHRQSCFLVGRDRKVCDLPVDHPSCSKQHAALQYRLVPFEREDGTSGRRVRPYIIDLESANGTFINNKQIEPKKYIELLEKDVIKFGFSSREYVLLHENSKEDQLDDDVVEFDEVAVKPDPDAGLEGGGSGDRK